jgi:bifunctional enzyme CysN/CysC
MHVVVAGHVDHGKSTVIGRLLADTGSLPDGKLEQVRATCERTSQPFEYAFLLDALKDEQSQGITIDAARVFFRTPRRHYLIIDAPGHVEFLKNMITGASRAEAALLVLDAREGVQENSRRHGYLLALIGVRQVAVLVNKMDLVGHDRRAFEAVAGECADFLRRAGVRPAHVIPVCGRSGDNIAARSDVLSWYGGPTALEALEEFEPEPPAVDRPFRMPVQDVYKFTRQGDDRRIVAGTVASGTVKVGDEVVFYPSGKKSQVASIEAFNRPPPLEARAGSATGFTLREQIYVTRGEVATLGHQPRPSVTTRLRVSLFWLGRNPLEPRRDYVLKLGTARVLARVETVLRVVDAASLDATPGKQRVDRHEVAECVLRLNRGIAVDLPDEVAATSRFVLLDDFEIRGGGIVREALPDRQALVRDRVLLRNYKWDASHVSPERRAERYGQKAALLLISSARDVDRKSLARELERRLFEEGRLVYFLGIGNVLYGVDADIERNEQNRREHLRRLSEVAHILLDAGLILIVTAAELTRDEVELFRTTLDPEPIETIWIGDGLGSDLGDAIQVPGDEAAEDALQRVKERLADRGVIFRPW